MNKKSETVEIESGSEYRECVLRRSSPVDGSMNEMTLPVPAPALLYWIKNRHNPSVPLVQDAFPELDDDQREFVLSGITPATWANLFPDD